MTNQVARLAMWLCLLLAVSATAQQPAYKDPKLPVEVRVQDLLQRMTLEEKVAQTLSYWQSREIVKDEKLLFIDSQDRFVPERAGSFLKNGIGQITRPGERRGPRATAEFTNAVQHYVRDHTRLGIPVMFHDECLHGYVAPGGTNYPVPIALASTWNPALVERIFTAVAREARSRGSQECLAPVLDLAREPRWGRFEETYGEDPYLVSQMGLAAIRGYQGRTAPLIDSQHVLATAKHFAVHGQPEAGTNIGPQNYSERIIRDYWMAPFRVVVQQAGVSAIMPSYNEVDGIPNHSNRKFLETILRQEWGFRGMVVSDYFAVEQLSSIHHVVADDAAAGRLALQSGVDLELPLPQSYKTLADQVKSGLVSEALLDRAVASVLRAKFNVGLFENPFVDEADAEKIQALPSNVELARSAARQSIILLKNQNGLLPLDARRLKRVAVIGPNAGDAHVGGYSDAKATGVSILQGIKDRLGSSARVDFAEGARITESQSNWTADAVTPPDPKLDVQRIANAVAVAKGADVAIVVVGENESTSREAWADNHLGDRDSLDLIGRQDEMVAAILKTKVPTVVVLLHGRPNSINFIAENVPAILDGWYLGQEGGHAVADVLFGDFNPAGRLPITVPRSVGQIPAYYYQKPSGRRGYLFSDKSPLFPFGWGLSYTTFSYSNLKVTPDTIGPAGSVTVSVDVTNTGKVKGDDVAQLYIHDLVSSVTRPVKELRAFERVTLDPGETRTVKFSLDSDALAFTNRDMKRVVEPGDFDIMVGPNSVSLTKAVLHVVEPTPAH